MSLLVLDDQGQLWHGDSRRLRAAFDSPFSGGEFVEYAVKNLGFVAINLYGASCQVRLRPGFVGEKALCALLDWLRGARLERVVLSVFEGGWRDELVRRARAIPRIQSLVEARERSEQRDFLAKPAPVAEFTTRREAREIALSWPFLLENYDAQTLLELLRHVFEERFVVVRKSESQGRLVFGEISDAIYSGFDTWRTCAVGAPIEEQPDRSYGRWVAGAYYQAERARLPQHELIDAIMRLPDARSVRVRYRRLIFPLPAGSAGNLLVGGTLMDSAVDLRVGAR
jgi:hypothetical protein